MEGGTAIARTLLGQSNPGGKLPLCVPTSPQHLPPFDRFARTCDYGMLHGYTKLDADASGRAKLQPVVYSRRARQNRNRTRALTTWATSTATRCSSSTSRSRDQRCRARPEKKSIQARASRRCDVLLTFPLHKLRVYDRQARVWRHEPGALLQLLLG